MTIRGLTLRDAASTFFGKGAADAHWLPSEGDWALQRSGAVTIEGAEAISIDRCQLTRVDGNGIFLGGYTRDVSITRSDFNWLGGSATAAFGWTSDCLYANCRYGEIEVYIVSRRGLLTTAGTSLQRAAAGEGGARRPRGRAAAPNQSGGQPGA